MWYGDYEAPILDGHEDARKAACAAAAAAQRLTIEGGEQEPWWWRTEAPRWCYLVAWGLLLLFLAIGLWRR